MVGWLSGARRCTAEVHPQNEALHLRSSKPHPKADFSKSRIASRRVKPWPKCSRISFFETRLAFRRFWAKEPRHERKTTPSFRKHFNGNVRYLDRRTRRVLLVRLCVSVSLVLVGSLLCCAVRLSYCLSCLPVCLVLIGLLVAVICCCNGCFLLFCHVYLVRLCCSILFLLRDVV